MGRPNSTYWDRTASRYALPRVGERLRSVDKDNARQALQVVQDDLRPDMEVLEFGCGAGAAALAFAPFVKHIQAIDIAEGMLQVARDEATAAGIDAVTFERTAIEDFGAPDRRFDAVIGLRVLPYLADPDAAIARVRQWLKPSGIFICSTNFVPGNPKWLMFFSGIAAALGMVPRTRNLSAQTLESSLSASGFTIDRRWMPDRGNAVIFMAKRAD